MPNTSVPRALFHAAVWKDRTGLCVGWVGELPQEGDIYPSRREDLSCSEIRGTVEWFTSPREIASLEDMRSYVEERMMGLTGDRVTWVEIPTP